jgi:hypothetical protein
MYCLELALCVAHRRCSGAIFRCHSVVETMFKDSLQQAGPTKGGAGVIRTRGGIKDRMRSG